MLTSLATHLLNGLEGIMRNPCIGGVASQTFEVLTVLLEMRCHILTCHAIHVHQLQDGLRHSILHALHSQEIPSGRQSGSSANLYLPSMTSQANEMYPLCSKAAGLGTVEQANLLAALLQLVSRAA